MAVINPETLPDSYPKKADFLEDYHRPVPQRTKSSSSKRVSQDEDQWEQESLEELYRIHPWMRNYRVVTDLTGTSSEGYAIGKHQIWPKSLPPHTTVKGVPLVTVPICIEDFRLYPQDIFLYKGNPMYLTENRVAAALRVRDSITPSSSESIRKVLQKADNGSIRDALNRGKGSLGGTLWQRGGRSVKMSGVDAETKLAHRLVALSDSFEREVLPRITKDVADSDEFYEKLQKASSTAEVNTAVEFRRSNDKVYARRLGKTLADSFMSSDWTHIPATKVSQFLSVDEQTDIMDGKSVLHDRDTGASFQILETSSHEKVSYDDGSFKDKMKESNPGDWIGASAEDSPATAVLSRPEYSDLSEKVPVKLWRNLRPSAEDAREYEVIAQLSPEKFLFLEGASEVRRVLSLPPESWETTGDASRIPIAENLTGGAILFPGYPKEGVTSKKRMSEIQRNYYGAYLIPETESLRASFLLVTDDVTPSGKYIKCGPESSFGDEAYISINESLPVGSEVKSFKSNSASAPLGKKSTVYVLPENAVFLPFNYYGSTTSEVEEIYDAFFEGVAPFSPPEEKTSSAPDIEHVPEPNVFLRRDLVGDQHEFTVETPLRKESGLTSYEAVRHLVQSGCKVPEAVEACRRSIESPVEGYLDDSRYKESCDVFRLTMEKASQVLREKVSATKKMKSSRPYNSLVHSAKRLRQSEGLDKQSLAGETIESVLMLEHLNENNLFRFIETIPSLESCLSDLCALLLVSRIGLKEIDETACRSAVRNLDQVLKGLKQLEYSLIQTT